MMSDITDKISHGWALAYIASALSGFPWDKAASFATLVWFVWKIGDKAYAKFKHQPEPVE